MKKKYAYVLVAVILWGLTYLLLKPLLTRFPPSELLVIRFSGSFILTLIFLLATTVNRAASRQYSSNSGSSRWQLIFLALLAGVYLAMASITQKYGIHILGKPVHAAFLTGLVALFLPTLQKARTYFFPKYRPAGFTWKQICFPLFLAVCGTTLLCDFKFPSPGDILVIICAVFYALQLDLSGAFKHKWPPYATHLCGCVSCVALGLAIAGLMDNGAWAAPDAVWEYIGLSVLIVLSTFIPWCLIHWTVQEESVNEYVIGILYAMEPVVALAAGWLLGIEMLNPANIAGCILIVWSAERTCRL